MILRQDNHAYIDGANLHRGTRSLGLHLDYTRFRVWLKEKYSVTHAYIFLGHISSQEQLYSYLQKSGFILIFKETVRDTHDKVKGNCDADMVLRVVKDTYEDSYDEAIIVTSDGDFSCLVEFLQKRKKIKTLISPYLKCSRLLRKVGTPLMFISNVKPMIEKNAAK